MAIFITRARLTKDGMRELIAAPEDRSEAVHGLIAQAGGKLIASYLTTGDYDILLIFEGSSFEDTVPALIAAAAGSDLSDLNTVMALTTSEMKTALVKAKGMMARHRSAGTATAVPSVAEPETKRPSSDQQPEEPADDSQADAKAGVAILDAQKKAIDDIRAGHPAPYFIAPPMAPIPSRTVPSPRSTDGQPDLKK
jgi:uncharacterized protein with GYD domain